MSENFLCTLENLLNEFYDASSNNTRKQQIEVELQGLSKYPKAWEYCVQLLQHTKSQYSQWWALTTLEDVVCWSWERIDSSNRNNLRQFMYEKCVSISGTAPSYIITKYIKVFVSIGIRQWSQDSFFFEQIMKLVNSNNNVIGITMLLVLSEELNRPRHDLTSNQFLTCKKLLHDSVNVILSTIISLLEGLLSDKDKRHPTPHSSPGSNPPVSPRPGSPLALCSTSPLHSGSNHSDLSTSGNNELLTRLLQQPHNTKTLLSLDEAGTKTGEAALKCLAHLLSWVPISEVVTPGLISTIFVFAKQGSPEIATHAMSCINETVGRNRVPNHLEEFILHLFHQTLQLLAKASEEEPGNLDKGYNKKFVEFLNLFVSGHLRRVESNASFPILDFLSLLFKFTFNQTDLDLFYDSLDVCSCWVDFLISLQGYMSPDGTVERYGNALQQLTELLLYKVRFATNGNEVALIEHDTEGLSDGEHTEWDLFIGKTTQLLSKVIELCPITISDVIIRLYTEHCEGLYQIQSYMVIQGNDVFVTDVTKETLVTMLRDVGTVTHMAQLVQASLTGDNFNTRTPIAQTLLYHTMKCIEIAKRVIAADLINDPEIQKAFCDIFVNNVYILTMFSQWFVEYGHQPDHGTQYVAMVTTVLDSVLPSINNQESYRLQQAILELLHKFVLVLRPDFLTSISSVQQLYTLALQHTFLYSPQHLISTLNKTLTLGLVLPWQLKNDEQQQWDRRTEQFEQFVQGIFSDILKIKVTDVDTDVKLLQLREIITRDINCLCDVVACVAHRENKSKQVVCKAVKPVLSYIIQLLPNLQKEDTVFEAVLHFTTILCDGLRVQLGAQFLQELVGLCLKLFSTQRSAEKGLIIVEKFIALLTSVVKEPSSTYKSFTNDVISITLNELWPYVEKKHMLSMPYYALLHAIMDFYWDYFYPRNSRDSCAQEECFVKIFQLYGESFLSTDFNLIKQNLIALIDLNDKHDLFDKSLFHYSLKVNFVTVFFELLFSGRAALISEDVEEIIFALVQSHPQNCYIAPLSSYFNKILPSSVAPILIDSLKISTDFTSFKLNLRDVISDAKYYLHQNVS